MSLRFDLGSQGFERAEGMLATMGDGLLRLRRSGDDVALPTLALGVAGEWPARHQYNEIWETLAEEFERGNKEAAKVSDMMHTSRRAFTEAELAAGQGVLDAVTKSRAAGGFRPEGDAPEGAWEELPSLGESLRDAVTELAPWFAGPAGLISGAGLRAMGGSWNREAATRLRGRTSRIDYLQEQVSERTAAMEDSLRTYPKAWKPHLRSPTFKRDYFPGIGRAEEDVARARSELAKWSAATDRNLKRAREFSWAAMAAGLAWASLMIPSDETLDRAVLGWRQLAWDLGQIFGHDTATVREAVLSSWEGASSSDADRRLLEFVAAGNVLTERVSRLSRALAETVDVLKRIHWTAMIFSTAVAATIAGLGFMGRANPQSKLLTEYLGSRLTTVILLIAGIAPVLSAVGAHWWALRDADVSIRLGDREIIGFRKD